MGIIDSAANRNNNQQQVENQLNNMLQEVSNAAGGILTGTNINSDKINTTLEPLRQIETKIKDIQKIIQDVQSAGLNINVNNIAQALNDVKDGASDITTAFNSLQTLLNGLQIGTDLNNTLNNISNSVQNLSSNTENYFNSISNAADDARDHINDLMDAAGGGTNNQFSLFAKSMEQDLKNMEDALSNSSNNLQDQFNKLRDIGGDAASSVIFDDKYMSQFSSQLRDFTTGQFRIFRDTFRDIEQTMMRETPDKIASTFSTSIGQLINGAGETNNNIIKQLITNLPGNEFKQLSNEVLNEYQNMYEDFGNNYETIITLGNHALMDLQNSANKGITGAKEAAATIRQNLKEIQNMQNEMQSSFSNARTQVFRNDVSEVQISGSELSNRYNEQRFDSNINQFRRFNSVANSANNVRRNAENLQEQLQFDPTVIQNVGSVNRHVNFEKLIGDANDIDKLFSAFNKNKEKLMQDLSSAMASRDTGRINSAKKELEELVEFSKLVNSKVMGMVSSVNVNSDDLKNVSGAKTLVDSLNSVLKDSKGHYKELYEAAKLLGVDESVLKSIKDMNTELTVSQGKFQTLSNESKSFGTTVSGAISAVLSPLKTVSSITEKAAGYLGISGLPISMSGINNYLGTASADYKNQALWREQALKAEVGIGDLRNPAISFEAADNRVYDKAMYYQKLSNGMIDFAEFNNAYTGLIKTVGGQAGKSDTQTIKDLNAINDTTFATSKLYDITEGTKQNFVKTFYKDLRKDADDVAFSFTKVAQSATTANVPVEKYMQIVTQLASSYKGIGLDANVAFNVLDKFTAQGMGEDEATKMATAVGQGTNKFADNQAMWLFSSAMSGQYTDFYGTLRAAQDRWNPDGSIKSGFAEMAAKNIDSQAKMWSGLGNTQDAKWYYTNDFIKNSLGISGQEGAQLTNAMMKGDYKLFEELLQKNDNKDEDKKTVVLENQKEAEQAIKSLTDQLSEAQKTEAMVARQAYDFAYKTAPARDLLISKLSTAIEELTTAANNIFAKLSGEVIDKLGKGTTGGGVLDSLAENPGEVIGGMLGLGAGVGIAKKTLKGSASAVKDTAKKGTSTIINKIKGLFGKGGSTGRVEAEVVETAGRVEATSGSKLLANAGKVAKTGGKLALPVLAAFGVYEGATYLYDKFSGKDKTSSKEKKSSKKSTVAETDSEKAILNIDRMISNKFTYDALKDVSGVGPTPTSATGLYGGLPAESVPGDISRGQYLDEGGYNYGNRSSINKGQSQILNDNTFGQPSAIPIIGVNDTLKNNVKNGAGLATSITGGKLLSKVTGVSAIKSNVEATKAVVAAERNAVKLTRKLVQKEAIKEAAEKLSLESAGAISEKEASRLVAPRIGQMFKMQAAAEKAAGEKLVAKTLLKGIGKGVAGNLGLGIAIDAAANYGELGYRAIKGDYVKGDIGKSSAGFIADASWTAGGTAIGTGVGAIFGGVGAVPGALIGGIAGSVAKEIYNYSTQDKSGKGGIDRWKDNMTQAFSGKSSEDIELTRMMQYGGEKEVNKAVKQLLESTGVSTKTSQDMVKILEKHSNEINNLNNEDKFNWALLYSQLKNNNPKMKEQEIVNELQTIYGEGNEEAKEAVNKNLNKATAKQTGQKEKDVKKQKKAVMDKALLLKKQQQEFNDAHDAIYNTEMEKEAERLNISVDTYKKVLKDKKNRLYDTVKAADEDIQEKADEKGDKALTKFNKKGKKITQQGIDKIYKITDDYEEMAKVAEGQGKTKLADIFMLKDNMKDTFFKQQNDYYKKQGVKTLSEAEKKAIAGEYLTDAEKEEVAKSGRASSLKSKYQDRMDNAYNIKAFENVANEEIFNTEKRNKYIEFYNKQQQGTLTTKDKADPLFKGFEDFLKKNNNNILANIDNLQKSEDAFKQKMVDDLTKAIETGDSNMLQKYQDSYNLSLESKSVLTSINGNIVKLAEGGYVGPDNVKTDLNAFLKGGEITNATDARKLTALSETTANYGRIQEGKDWLKKYSDPYNAEHKAEYAQYLEDQKTLAKSDDKIKQDFKRTIASGIANPYTGTKLAHYDTYLEAKEYNERSSGNPHADQDKIQKNAKIIDDWQKLRNNDQFQKDQRKFIKDTRTAAENRSASYEEARDKAANKAYANEKKIQADNNDINVDEMTLPTTGAISSNYGMRTDPTNGKWKMHSGVDIAADKGTPVYTMFGGKVTFTGNAGDGYGNRVDITNGEKIERFGHLSKISVQAEKTYAPGTKIGEVGSTGKSTDNHLHYEVRDNKGNTTNPLQALQGTNISAEGPNGSIGSSDTIYGALSARMESQGNPGDVSKDINGNWSFGKYQFFSSAPKNAYVNKILENEQPGSKWYDAFKQYKGQANRWEEEGFKQLFKDYANAKPVEAEAFQDIVTKELYYDPAVKVMNKHGIDPNERSDALKNVMWQLSVNQGAGIGGGFDKVLSKVNNASSLTDEQLINALYNQSKIYAPENKNWYENSRIEALKLLKSGAGATKIAGNYNTEFNTGYDVSSNSNSDTNDPFKIVGMTSEEFNAQTAASNTAFAQGTLFHGILPENFGISSYSTGDSTTRFNHLKNIQDLLNAGGSEETFTINSQAIGKSIRDSLNTSRTNTATSQGRSFYDQFSADIGQDTSSTMYRTGNVYQPSIDAMNTTSGGGDKPGAVIGISVVNQNNIDPQELTKRIAGVLDEMGVTAKIEEVSSGVGGLQNTIDSSINSQNNARRAQYT